MRDRLKRLADFASTRAANDTVLALHQNAANNGGFLLNPATRDSLQFQMWEIFEREG
jgi:hypothetical protein